MQYLIGRVQKSTKASCKPLVPIAAHPRPNFFDLIGIELGPQKGTNGYYSLWSRSRLNFGVNFDSEWNLTSKKVASTEKSVLNAAHSEPGPRPSEVWSSGTASASVCGPGENSGDSCSHAGLEPRYDVIATVAMACSVVVMLL